MGLDTVYIGFLRQKYGRRANNPPPSFRIYDYIPLHFSAAHDGPGAVASDIENTGAAHRRRKIQPRRALLGADIRDQFCDGRCYRYSDGISIRHELGGIFALGWRSDRPNTGDGRSVFIFPGVEFSGADAFWREAIGAIGPLVCNVSCVARFVAFGIFDYRHERVDATSSGVLDGLGWQLFAGELLGVAAESVGDLAIRAQYARRGADGMFCDGRDGGFLCAL